MGKLLFILFFVTLHLIISINSSRVEFLPGFDGPLPFKLETGYIGVGQYEDVQLFYYFFESEKEDNPLLFWYTGGPGCSGVSAIFYENGPLKFEEFKYNGSLPRLMLNTNSWTKVASIIYIDLPVGTGFSYGRTVRATYSSDKQASHHANEFLRKWLNDHPQFLQNPVYLGGDSYTGFTLPLYFDEMSKGNEQGQQPLINLKGYLLGNPVTDPDFDSKSVIPFAHGMGLISDELYERLKTSCKENYIIDPDNAECSSNLLAYYKCLTGIATNMILEPLCGYALTDESSILNDVLGSRISLVYEEPQQLIQPQSVPSLGEFACRSDGYLLASYWLNDASVQEAIRVRKGSIDQWIRCNYGTLNYTNDISSSLLYHVNLSAKGYRSLIYSGDHDMIVPFLGTQAWIRSLGYPIVDDWRSWWVDGQVAGYTRTYANQMTFATIKGGGHTAPEYRPRECAEMFSRWISGEPL